MRVCMLIWKYWPGLHGGAERQCRLLSHALRDAGANMTVVTHWPGFGTRRLESDSGVHIVRLGLAGPAARVVDAAGMLVARVLWRRSTAHLVSAETPQAESRRPSRLASLLRVDLEKLAFVLSARRFFEQHRGAFDILHVHESHWLAGFGVEVASSLGIPVLVKEALSPVLTPLIAGFPYPERFDLLRRQACYVALTPDIAVRLAEQGVVKERIVEIPNGVELPPQGANVAENSLVLCVASLQQGNYHKGFSTLLAGWREVRKRHPSAILAIVGGGDARPWKESAARLGLGNSVRFPGATRDPAAWYRQSAVFVLPSRREGLSNALLEAQSWGIPAVVSDIPGNLAVVKDGVNGIVFPVGDESRLAAGIIRLLDAPAERKAMGLAGRRRIEEQFLISAVASRLMDVYRRLAPQASVATQSQAPVLRSH